MYQAHTYPDGSRRLLHDVEVRRVEAESSGGEAVGDKVDPEQLHWDQGLGKTQGGCQEDAERKGRREGRKGEVKMFV